MKISHFLIYLPLSLLCACASMKVDSYYESKHDFKQYKTYAWIHRPKNHRHSDTLVKNEIVEREIIRYSKQELEARGYQPDTLNPDVLLDYSLTTKKTTELRYEPLYVGNYDRYYYNGVNFGMYSNVMPYGMVVPGGNTVEVPVTEGTITVYVIDRVKNKLIWQGAAKGTISSARSFKKELPRNIKALFNKYPVKKK